MGLPQKSPTKQKIKMIRKIERMPTCYKRLIDQWLKFLRKMMNTKKSVKKQNMKQHDKNTTE